MESIARQWPKIKAFAEDTLSEWGLFIAVVLLALASFALGRLSALIEARPLVSVTEAKLLPSQAAVMAPGGLYVASRGGSTYYFPWCSGADRILPQNQRWFQSAEDARRAGYRPAKNCKGLVEGQ